MQEALRSGDVSMRWDPKDAVALMRFEGPGAVARVEDARTCIDAIAAWTEGGSVRLLVDCAGLKDTDPGWRSEFARFFRTRPSRIAWYNMTPLIGMMVRMFLLGTGSNGRGFRDADEARAWLLGEGA